MLSAADVPVVRIGSGSLEHRITINYNGEPVLDESMAVLRQWWEETSYQLERLQMNPDLC